MNERTAAKLSVLMIDDSEFALEVQVMSLERAGFTVHACLDLDELAATPTSFSPDVVLTDVGLGEATVEEAVAAIRNAFPGVPVLLYSGREDHELAALAKELGVDGFINKADADMIGKLRTASGIEAPPST